MDPENIKEKKESSSLSVPLAIIVAGVIIAGAVFISKGSSGPTGTTIADTAVTPTKTINLAPITDKDHLLGKPDASIVLVEYADLECPACKYFDPILQQMMTDYGKSGQVAWIFRNFPIKELHSKAPKEAEAAECVAQIGGNQKYWNFVNKLYDVSPGNNGLDPAQLPIIASSVGVDTTTFNTCLSSGKNATIVSADYNTGVTAGVNGTPTSYFVLKTPLSKDSISKISTETASFKDQYNNPLVTISDDGKIMEIAAAFPYNGLKQILDSVLAEEK